MHSLAEAGKLTPRWQRLGDEGARPPPPAARRLERARRRAAAAPRSASRRGATRPARTSRCGRRRSHATGNDVWLFTGCVMDAWLRPVHAAALRVLSARGRRAPRCPGRAAIAAARSTCTPGSPTTPAASLAGSWRSMPGDAPILVDSAGCGAALKDYGHLLGTAEAAAFSARVLDIHEWLATRMDSLPPPPRSATARRRAGSVPSPPRAAHPPRRCARCSIRTSRSSSSTTRGCAAVREARTPRCIPRRRARSGRASSSRSPARAPTSSRAPTPAARCTSRPRACESAIRSRSSPVPREWALDGR